MSYQNEIRPQSKTHVAKRPAVTSYDTCHEHSVEHWIELQLMVEVSAEEIIVIAERKMIATA